MFNGNLVLEKVLQAFNCWVSQYNQLANPGSRSSVWRRMEKIKYLPSRKQCSLQTGWLSGFMQADGGLYVALRESLRSKYNYRLVFKFYITQKGKEQVLLQIGACIQEQDITTKSALKVYIHKNLKRNGNKVVPAGETLLLPLTYLKQKEEKRSVLVEYEQKEREQINTFSLQITNQQHLQTICDYFENYPMHGEKQNVYTRWREIFLNRKTLIDSIYSDGNLANLKAKIAFVQQKGEREQI